MPGLREIQKQLAAALFDETQVRVLAWIGAGAFEPAARVSIYRNNLREGFRKALALEFPVIEQLVGAEYFQQLALAYLRAHPSRSGNLHGVGARFAGFVSDRFRGTSFDYLPDVAALEWALQEVAVAADCAPLDARELQDTPAEAYAQLEIGLHPGCRLLASAYPIVRIWSSNQPGAAPESVDLGAGGDRVLVRRAHDGCEFRRLAPGDYALASAFAAGLNLGAALEAAWQADAHFDLTSALQQFLRLGALVRRTDRQSHPLSEGALP